jgi:hypothetical protein
VKESADRVYELRKKRRGISIRCSLEEEEEEEEREREIKRRLKSD